MLPTDAVVSTSVHDILSVLQESLKRKDYAAVPQILEELWLLIRFTGQDDLLSMQEQFGADVSRCIDQTRLQIRRNNIRGAHILPQLQSIATKIGDKK